jgi:hypothetical protein
LSTEIEDGRKEEPRYEGEALILHGRITDLERRDAEREKDIKQDRKDHLEINRKQLIANQRIGWFTFALVFCTVIGNYVAIRQANIAKSAAEAANRSASAAAENAELVYWGLKDSEESSALTLQQMEGQTEAQRTSAKASESAAKSANQTIADARQAFRKDQRPYIYFEPRGCYSYKDGGTGETRTTVYQPIADNKTTLFCATGVFKNSGKSPAVNGMNTIMIYAFGPSEEARAKVRAFTPTYISEPGYVLAVGNTTVPSSDALRLTDENMAALKNGSWELYVFGGVAYADLPAKAGSRPYETTYCYQVVITGLAFHNCNFGPNRSGNAMK